MKWNDDDDDCWLLLVNFSLIDWHFFFFLWSLSLSILDCKRIFWVLSFSSLNFHILMYPYLSSSLTSMIDWCPDAISFSFFCCWLQFFFIIVIAICKNGFSSSFNFPNWSKFDFNNNDDDNDDIETLTLRKKKYLKWNHLIEVERLMIDIGLHFLVFLITFDMGEKIIRIYYDDNNKKHLKNK